MKTKEWKFNVTGGFDIDKTLQPYVAHDGGVVGFTLPDGRTVRLVVALEIESKDGSKFDYITADQIMGDLGFAGLDYDRLEFEEL